MNSTRLILPALLFLCTAVGTHSAEPPHSDAKTEEPAPLYVDSQAIKDRFSTVTAEDMEMLKSKKILFTSQSFGQNMRTGLKLLAKEDKKYDWPMTTEWFKNLNWKADGNFESNIPADVFSKMNFVHFAVNKWPMTKRVDDMEALIRKEPYQFGKTVDAVMIFYHMASPPEKVFEYYAPKMDAMQADFPNARFIYVTSGLSGPGRAKTNEESQVFGELIRARYKGKVPLYDMGKILSDDFRNGHVVCPEYTNDPAELHPNLPAGEIALAKGFILVLRDAFRAPWPPAEKLAPLKTGPIPPPKVDTLPADHPDVVAVKAILDANGIKGVNWESLSVVENGRIVKLYIHECGIKSIPSSIGVLTELRTLDVYGDRSLSRPLLETIDPAIGSCTKLEELLLNSNDLTTLPDTIVNLSKLKQLTLADNHLQNLPPPVNDWAKRLDPKGLETQHAPASAKP